MAPQWKDKKCNACEGGVRAWSGEKVRKTLTSFPGWNLKRGRLIKAFKFKDYEETTSFVNGVIQIAREENHHPDIQFGYKICKVSYFTHSVKGITENDFICIAKIENFSKPK